MSYLLCHSWKLPLCPHMNEMPIKCTWLNVSNDVYTDVQIMAVYNTNDKQQQKRNPKQLLYFPGSLPFQQESSHPQRERCLQMACKYQLCFHFWSSGNDLSPFPPLEENTRPGVSSAPVLPLGGLLALAKYLLSSYKNPSVLKYQRDKWWGTVHDHFHHSVTVLNDTK